MKKNTKYKSNLITKIVAIFGFLFVLTLGFKSSTDQNELTHYEEIEDKSIENNELKIDIESNINGKNSVKSTNKDVINNSENIINIVEKDVNDNEIFKKSDVYVNKIVITKNIDNDISSDNYRNPIDSFKTITTIDKNVLKEINYHPNFYIWASINTENETFLNENGDFIPLEMGMKIMCNDKNIKNLNFTITANTPRWREWIKIDLNEIENNFLNQMWTVEIKNNSNDKIIESRNFQLMNDNEVYVSN